MFAKGKMIIHSILQRPLYVAGVLGLIMWLVVGCTNTTIEPDPKKAIRAEDLIVPESILPAGWEYASKPRPMGPSAGFGDENDREIPFRLSDDPNKPESLAYQYVLHFENNEKAHEWYSVDVFDLFLQDRFGNIPFPSEFTSNLRVKCQDEDARPNHIHCALLGQYDEFVVVLNAVIPKDHITPTEFEEFARRIDRFIGERLVQR